MSHDGAVTLLVSTAPRIHLRSNVRPHGGIPGLKGAPTNSRHQLGPSSPQRFSTNFQTALNFPFTDAEVHGNFMPVRLGSLRVPDISMEDWRKRSPAHRTVQQDLYLQRCQQRRKDNIKRIRKALKERTAAHTVSAMFAGTEIRVDGDLCKAEERF